MAYIIGRILLLRRSLMDIGGLIIDLVDADKHLWCASIGLCIVAYGSYNHVVKVLRDKHFIEEADL
jgi:hypothetical protein